MVIFTSKHSCLANDALHRTSSDLGTDFKPNPALSKPISFDLLYFHSFGLMHTIRPIKLYGRKTLTEEPPFSINGGPLSLRWLTEGVVIICSRLPIGL